MRNPKATALQKIVRPRFQGSLGNHSQDSVAMEMPSIGSMDRRGA